MVYILLEVVKCMNDAFLGFFDDFWKISALWISDNGFSENPACPVSDFNFVVMIWMCFWDWMAIRMFS